MAAPKGNQYWKLAHNWHKPKKYQPEDLLDKAIEYQKWCERNPLIEEKAFGTGFVAKMNKMRATTIQGFCFFCNMSPSTWKTYEKEEAYSTIISRVKEMFFSQKFEGAAAGLLDSNIIAREIGLVDKKDVTSDGQKITPTIIVQDKQTCEEINKLIKPVT